MQWFLLWLHMSFVGDRKTPSLTHMKFTSWEVGPKHQHSMSALHSVAMGGNTVLAPCMTLQDFIYWSLSYRQGANPETLPWIRCDGCVCSRDTLLAITSTFSPQGLSVLPGPS